MILAEELDARLSSMVTAGARAARREALRQPVLGFQATGSSTSVRAFWKPLRQAGADARAMLMRRPRRAGASTAAMPDGRTARSFTIASGRKLAYGELVAARPQLRRRRRIRRSRTPRTSSLIGKPLKRLDTPDKVNGKAAYGIDALPPGVKFATLAAARCSAARSRMSTTARPRPCPACARSSCSTISSRWSATTCGPPSRASRRSTSPGTTGRTPQVSIGRRSGRAAQRQRASDGAVAKEVGDADKALGAAGDDVEAAYEMPFLAHAPWSR